MDFRVVTYYTEWSRYRKDIGKYSLNDIGPCHIAVYSFAIMDPTTFEITSADQQIKDFYSEFVNSCSANGRTPILAVGGWVDSTLKYSAMLSVPENRSKFIASAVEICKQNGFRGINLDIEYPTCLQADFKNGNMTDKENFIELLREMKKELSRNQFELSVCIPGSPCIIDRAYDIKSLNDNLDWIGVMTYDYNISSMKTIGPISSISNTRSTIDHLIKNGADSRKLIVGVPFYGHRYILDSSDNPSYGAQSTGQGPAGQYTNEKGFLAYYEIRQLISKHGYVWKEDQDGAFAYKENDFISFNSEKDISHKIDLVKRYNLGGLMSWESSMDDFTGKVCNEGQNPLMSHIWRNLTTDT